MCSTPTKTSRDSLTDQKGKKLILKGINLTKLRLSHQPGFRDLKILQKLKMHIETKKSLINECNQLQFKFIY